MFAIALTLLVLDLRIPEGATSALEVLQQEWPSYVSFALSFIVIAYFWVGHHRLFKAVVATTPASSSSTSCCSSSSRRCRSRRGLISEFAPEAAAVVLYAALVALLAVVQLLEWSYARRRGLLADWVDAGLFQYVLWDLVPVVIVFGGSIAVALLVGGSAATYSWFAMFVVAPVAGIIVTRGIDRRRSLAGAGESDAVGARGRVGAVTPRAGRAPRPAGGRG